MLTDIYGMSPGYTGLCFLPSMFSQTLPSRYLINSLTSCHRCHYCRVHIRLVRQVPLPRQSQKRKLGIHRRVPSASTRVPRRSDVCDILILDQLDRKSQHPLDRSSSFGHSVRIGILVKLHGYGQLPYRRLWDLLCQCCGRYDEQSMRTWSGTAVCSPAVVQPARCELGMLTSRLLDAGHLCDSGYIYTLRTTDSRGQQVLWGTAAGAAEYAPSWGSNPSASSLGFGDNCDP